MAKSDECMAHEVFTLAFGGLALREAEARDEPFLRRLYRSLRDPELTLTGWSEEVKAAFANQQFDWQARAYRGNGDGSRFFVVEEDGAPIGRIVLRRTPGEVHVMDIAFVPQARNAGRGSKLLRSVIADAARAGDAITLQVEPANPARRLYARLGFREASKQGLHLCLTIDAPATGG